MKYPNPKNIYKYFPKPSGRENYFTRKRREEFEAKGGLLALLKETYGNSLSWESTGTFSSLKGIEPWSSGIFFDLIRLNSPSCEDIQWQLEQIESGKELSRRLLFKAR